MKLCVWPACIECSFIKLERGRVTKSCRDCFGDPRTMTVDVIECVHVPVCSRIMGQDMIEGEKDASVA